MHLIQVFLPLYDELGHVFSEEHFTAVRKQLTERFGGITTYSRAPARGFWKEKGKVHKDDLIVFEVMAEHLDRQWWEGYRRALEVSFRQEEILIRTQMIEVL